MRYLQIAEGGYQAVGEERFNLVGLPLYPWLVRGVSWLGLNVGAGAIVVSTVATIACAILFSRLVAMEEGEETGRLAIWFLFIYPTAYFLHLAYTEATLLALVLGSFLAAHKRAWLYAGLLGAFAAMTRWQGLILLPALATEAWLHHRATKQWDYRWFYLLLIPSGFGVYLLVNYHVTGDPFAFTKLMSENFYREFAPPWVGARSIWDSLHEEGKEYVFMVGGAEAAFTLLAFAFTIWSWFTLRVSYSIWMTGNFLLCICSSVVQAVPRYTLIMFPAYLLLARATRGRALPFAVCTCVSLLLLGLFLSKFVLGHWAF